MSAKPEVGEMTKRERRSFGSIVEVTGRDGFYLRIRRGGRNYLRRAGNTRAQAARNLAKVQTALLDGASIDRAFSKVLHGASTEHTFEELSALYLGSPDVARNAKRQATDESRLKQVCMARWAGKPVSAISSQEISVWAEAQRGRRTGATVNRYLSVASSVFRWGITQGHATENPARYISRPKEHYQGDPLDQEDQAKLLKALREEDVSFQVLFLAAIRTGLRQSNLLRLQWKHVDLERREIRLAASEMKAKRDHMVPIVDDELLAGLKSLRETPSAFVFRLSSGEPYTRKMLVLRWEAVLQRAQVRHRRWHDLRHTFCTDLARAGAGGLEIKTMAGHGSVRMAERYVKADKELAVMAGAKLRSYIAGAREKTGTTAAKTS